MNRKFKFRVWSKKLNEWITNISSIDAEGRLISHSVEVTDDKKIIHHIGLIGDDFECVIQQFTGLKDKNNKEVWEGDIVKLGKVVGIVIYSEESICFLVNVVHRWENFDTDWEVIGNIFENPELLK